MVDIKHPSLVKGGVEGYAMLCVSLAEVPLLVRGGGVTHCGANMVLLCGVERSSTSSRAADTATHVQ